MNNQDSNNNNPIISLSPIEQALCLAKEEFAKAKQQNNSNHLTSAVAMDKTNKEIITTCTAAGGNTTTTTSTSSITCNYSHVPKDDKNGLEYNHCNYNNTERIQLPYKEWIELFPDLDLMMMNSGNEFLLSTCSSSSCSGGSSSTTTTNNNNNNTNACTGTHNEKVVMEIMSCSIERDIRIRNRLKDSIIKDIMLNIQQKDEI